MILDNDTVTYKKYFRKYVTSAHSREFLYYAVLMAEKNNYSKAYDHIATILDFPLEDPLAYNSQFSTYSLLKAYEMGDNDTKSSINYMYIEKGKKVPKSSSIYCKE